MGIARRHIRFEGAIKGLAWSQSSASFIGALAAQPVVLPNDSGKFQPTPFCTRCELSNIHEMVTGQGTASQDEQTLRDIGIAVILARALQSEKDAP